MTWKIGSYIDLHWDDEPAFLAVKGHVPMSEAAKTVNSWEGSEYKPEDFYHGYLKCRFDGGREPLIFMACKGERGAFPATIVDYPAGRIES